MWVWLHKFASPPHCYRLARTTRAVVRLERIRADRGCTLWRAGARTPDYQQGDAFRIIYVHAPSAWMSLCVYVVMALASAIGLIWRIKLAHAVAASCAPIGASFAFCSAGHGCPVGSADVGHLVGVGRTPDFGLILLFLYLGYIALRASIDDLQRADRASAVLALVGVVNVPIIHYSVVWWNTLHQPATVTKMAAPSISTSMLIPLLMMIVGFTLCFVALLLVRVRGEVLRRERSAGWIREAMA
mgnify:CR=1 FL=1